jgi:hypothetical protein
MGQREVSNTMRVYHRYLGFFLVGIMALYSVSGIIMIFRNTNFLKSEKLIERQFPPNVKADDLGRMLRIRDFKVLEENEQTITFNIGTYNKETGIANYKSMELPTLVSKLENMHKATTDRPLFFLNIFFGLSLFFFVISSLWMFLPGTDPFKKGMYFMIAGLVLALIMVLV